MRVFIADDSYDIRIRLVDMVNELPDIECCGDAQDTPEAISQIKRLKPDAVILDIRMPGKSGIEVLEIIKKHNPALKVIMLTNYPEAQYRQKCMALGADHFLDKSDDFERLPEILNDMAADLHAHA